MNKCKDCGEMCEYLYCKPCIDEAIFCDKTRLRYINYDKKILKDWEDYYEKFWDDKPLPLENDYEAFSKLSEISVELIKKIAVEDVYCQVASMAWINEDRTHFEDWLSKEEEIVCC